MIENLSDIGLAILAVVTMVIIMLPCAAFSWLVTVSVWDAALKVMETWK